MLSGLSRIVAQPPPSFLCCLTPLSHHPSSLTSVSLLPIPHWLQPSTLFWPYGNHPFLKGKKSYSLGGSKGGMGELSWYLLGSVIAVFTWISKYITCISKHITWISKHITWISNQYPHFYAIYWFLMCNYKCTYNLCYKNHSPEKWHFGSLQSLLLPQFSTYRHRTGFIVKRKQVRIQESIRQNYKLVCFCYKFLKLFILQKKKWVSKNFIKFIIIFFKNL